jgi:type II secretory pathway component PulF
MGFTFPTFRRAFRPFRTTAPQQRSLLRLIMVATEENLPLSPLISAWAADEYGIQHERLMRLAGLLRNGTPLPDAVEELQGVLGDEDVLAIRFGTQSGTLVASLRERLDEQEDVRALLSPRVRKTLTYVAVLILIGFVIISFVQIKIVPEFEKIMQEFDVPPPQSLLWSIWSGQIFANYWYLFVMAALTFAWFWFSPWPGRRMRMEMFGPFYRPLRELHFADVLEKLSVAAAAGRPIASAVSTLARYHFDPALRRRLLFVRNEMEQGADAWQSLQTVGLLGPKEVRLLETAERVGNRSWILKRLAELKKRRTSARLSRLAELVLPVVIVIAGAYVLLQAVSVFSSLVNIIYSVG